MRLACWLGVLGFVAGSIEPPQSDSPIARCARASEGQSREICAQAFKFIKDTGADVPQSEALYQRLLDGARALGDIEGALAVSREAIRRFPANAMWYRQLGVILLDSRSAAFEAYGPLQEAVRLDPRDGIGRLRFADALLAMGRHEEALASYRTATSLSGPSWETAIGQASALRALGRRDEALDALNLARKSEPDHLLGTLSAQMRGDLLLELGRAEDAAREYRAILAKDVSVDERGLALCGLARSLDLLGPRSEAIRVCNEAAAAAQHKYGKPCACGK